MKIEMRACSEIHRICLNITVNDLWLFQAAYGISSILPISVMVVSPALSIECDLCK